MQYNHLHIFYRFIFILIFKILFYFQLYLFDLLFISKEYWIGVI